MLPIADPKTQTLDLSLQSVTGELLGMHRLKIDGLVDGVRQDVGATLHVKRRGRWVIPDKPDRLALGLTAHGFQVYGDAYVDEGGRHPGEPGFLPPLAAKAGLTAAQAAPDGYDHNYRDAAGHKPGDTGFIPPVGSPTTASASGVGTYNAAYCDANGRVPGQRGFIPPGQGIPGATFQHSDASSSSVIAAIQAHELLLV